MSRNTKPGGNSQDRPRTFACTAKGCGKAFVRSEHLSRHALNHRPSQVYSCDQCHKQFVRRDLLKRHEKRHEKGMWMRNVGGIVKPQLETDDSAEVEPVPAPGSEPQTELSPSASLPDKELEHHSHPSFRHEGSSSVSSPPTSTSILQPGISALAPLAPFTRVPHPSHPLVPAHHQGVPSQESLQLPQQSPASLHSQPSSSYALDDASSFDSFHSLFVDDAISTSGQSGDDERNWLWNNYSDVDTSTSTLSQIQPGQLPYDWQNSTVGTAYIGFPPSHVSSLSPENVPVHNLENSFNIWNVVRARLLSEFSNVATNIVSSTFFESTNLESFWNAYFDNYHPQYPFLHRPTLNPAEAPPLLVMSILALGATFASDVSHYTSAIKIHECLRSIIFDAGGFSPPAPLWCLQTLLLMQIQGKMFATRKHHDLAHIFHGAIIMLMRQGSVTQTYGQTETQAQTGSYRSYSDWVTLESSRRSAFFAFVMDAQHASLFGHKPALSVDDVRLPLPCDDALWECASLQETRQKLARAPRSLHFHSVLKALISGAELPSTCSTYARSIVLHGLISVIEHLKTHNVSTLGFASGTASAEPAYLDGAQRTTATDRRILLGQAIRNCAVVPCNRNGSPCFTAMHTLHRMARISIYANLVDIQIVAQATSLRGRRLSPGDRSRATARIYTWFHDPSAKVALREALELIRDTVFDGQRYRASEDIIAVRPWCLYQATLLCWVYTQLASSTQVGGTASMTNASSRMIPAHEYLVRLLASLESGDLGFSEVQKSQGFVSVIRDCLRGCRWELLNEAYDTLGRLVGDTT